MVKQCCLFLSLSFVYSAYGATAFIFTGVHANTLVAEVVRVSDGDTLWVKPNRARKAIKLRIKGIDAPEICQAYGHQAQEFLSKQLLHQKVTVITKRQDQYGRWLAQLEFQGKDVGRWMVQHGYAWSYHYPGKRGLYVDAQNTAKTLKQGLWASSESILEPRVFRQIHGKCP